MKILLYKFEENEKIDLIIGLKLLMKHREKTSTTLERQRMNKLYEELK